MLLKQIGVVACITLLAACVEKSSTSTSDNTPETPAEPAITLEANADPIEFGDTTTLTWSATNATTCTASGAWSGTKATSGTETTTALQADSDFNLECSNTNTNTSSSTQRRVRVNPPKAPTVQISASPASVNYNSATTLTWSSRRATSCEASGSWSGTKSTSGTLTTAALTTNSAFTLTCSGAGGSANATANVTVGAPPPNDPAPVVTFSASSTSIAYNGSTTLSWSSTNATGCTASGHTAWSGSKATSGSQTLSNLTADATFSLSCTGNGGTTMQSVSVTVAPPAPTLSFSASPTAVAANGSTTLTWDSTNATSCTASGGWTGTKTADGSTVVSGLLTNTTFSLSCTGSGGNVSGNVTVTILPVPTVTISANPTSVAYNGSTTLTWSTTNATSCTGSGQAAWNGSKSTSGSQTISNLTANATFTLGCTGSGGTTNQDVSVTVAAAPMPTLTFSANPTSVAYNGSTMLTWSTTNATACTASNGWTGSKNTSGTETVSGLTATATFALNCTGTGGSVSQSVTVSVTSGSSGTITGAVDSSRINRKGTNKVYLFSGTVAPDDYDGSGDPVASALVTQDENACTFSYSFTGIVPGTYTIAFTNQAASDVMGQDNVLTFVGTANITVGTSALAQNFAAARVLRVGSGKTYSKPSLAGAAAQDGDVIEIDAGEYVDDHMVWRDNNITIRGVGGRAHMRGTVVRPFISGDDVNNGMGMWVIRSSNVVVENIEFSGAMVEDLNGAGIRANGNGLTVCNSHFHDNQDGILGGVGEVLIEYSEFNDNGFGDPGFNHNIYIDTVVTKFIFRHNYSHDSIIGHTLKSRAVENHILYNRIMGEEGTTSYEIDIPNGGLTYIIGNVIQQGPNTDNSTIISYGAEGMRAGRVDRLHVINNTIVNDYGSGNFIYANGATLEARLVNNIFVGGGTDISGLSGSFITRTTNLVSNSPGLVNRAAYDYRLTGTSTAINVGSNPGSDTAGFDLRPIFHYVDPGRRAARISNGAYDIGAFEYNP